MDDWKLSVSANASTVILRDISNYVSVNNHNKSPIDVFYSGRNKLLNGVTPNYAIGNPTVIPLFLVGLISCTENYFREIIAGFIRLCPLAKAKSATKPLNLATAWFGYENLEKGAFENISFSNSQTIKKNLNNLLGYDISNSNQISSPIKLFGNLCELRHAIVHSAGFLAGKNAIMLELPNSRQPVMVTVGYRELQEAADICTSLICAINLDLFQHISKRWFRDWPRSTAYCEENFNVLFKEIWRLFFSEFDSVNGLICSPLSRTKVKNRIIKHRAK